MFKLNNLETAYHAFDYKPTNFDSIADKIVDPICIDSYNNVFYTKDNGIVDLKSINAVIYNTKIPIEVGLNDLPIDESRKMDINIELDGYCPKVIAKTIELPCCVSEEATRITDSLKEQGYAMNRKYTGICENNHVEVEIGLYIAIGIGVLILIIALAMVYLKRKKNQENNKESVTNTNNPLYGMDYDDYYAETRMEETNPNYDAYYKDDYVTNITEDNELYAQDEKMTRNYV